MQFNETSSIEYVLYFLLSSWGILKCPHVTQIWELLRCTFFQRVNAILGQLVSYGCNRCILGLTKMHPWMHPLAPMTTFCQSNTILGQRVSYGCNGCILGFTKMHLWMHPLAPMTIFCQSNAILGQRVYFRVH